jgi:hypothetical protein
MGDMLVWKGLACNALKVGKECSLSVREDGRT